MKKTAIALAAMAMIGQTYAALPGAIVQPKADEIGKMCDKAINDTKKRVAKIESLPLSKVSKDNTLLTWNQLDIQLQATGGPIGLLSETSPDEAVRKAAEACDLRISGYLNDMLQSTALYERVKALKPADAIDEMARQSILDEFESRGVSLPKDKRERVAAINNELDKLAQEFQRNVRDTKAKVTYTEAELVGVPKDALEGRAKDAEGRLVFGLDYPEYDAIMNYAENEQSRRRMYEAFNKRGGEANLTILKQVVTLRKELAGLFGYDNFADWSLKRKMAGSAAAVNQFLGDVKTRVGELEKREIGELAAEKAKFTGNPDAKMYRWDLLFYETRLKKARYSLDQQEVRAQFPTEPTLAWMMKVTSTLYGVDFRPNKQQKVWHPDVRAFDVYDSKSKQYLSSFYLDLFPRDGKYKHAAAFPTIGVSTIAKRTPISVLVTNFNRNGFDQDELETLFHEFGHVMHGVLSKTRYSMQAGTSVKRDFVEAPSQMYEEWARRPETHKLFNEVCSTCKPIDPALIAKMNAARSFGQGVKYARQVFFATWDMALHTANPGDPMQLWRDGEREMPLGHVDGTMAPAAFGHVIGGYQAGYYGYMWSEVLALDMLSGFGDNVMDAKAGARYRSIILENGGQVPPMKLVEEFLGRKTSPDAFFREITGQRTTTQAADAKSGTKG
ncbi:thimet oligopeptidase [Chitinivorax tropicus]|uniref:Thimet oligopeptidase n=1 Tax=Chitinivorax tropicus TaxID=714531 RepID=A0A840MSP7_9PROT|nr:M3 family metallopeptidase [Chitinivorax tropicus]MBB5020109.1 thimet oligopeptidase [Chitinivorax tropicus]